MTEPTLTFLCDGINRPVDREYYTDRPLRYQDLDKLQIFDNPDDDEVGNATTGDLCCDNIDNFSTKPIPKYQNATRLMPEAIQSSSTSATNDSNQELRTEPRIIPSTIAKYKPRTESSVSRKLSTSISKSFSCTKCHAIFSKKHHLCKHTAGNSCKNRCDFCGGKILRRYWAKHVMHCSLNLSNDEIISHHDNHKCNEIVVEKSDPCKDLDSVAKSTNASEPSKPTEKLLPLVSTSFSCPKCHAIFSKKEYLRKHKIRDSCKKYCVKCGGKVRRVYWANHVIRCKQNQSENVNALHHDNHKNHQNVEEKSDPCKNTDSVAQSTKASEPSKPPQKLTPLITKSFSCPKCHAIFSMKEYLRKHIIRDSCKKKCDKCGGKVRRAYWPKHVIRCKQNQSSKSHQKVEEKSEPCKNPGSIANSTMVSEPSNLPEKLAGPISKIFSCSTCHGIFKKKDYLRRHIARNMSKKNCDICGGNFFMRFLPKHIICCSQNRSKDDNILLHHNNHKIEENLKKSESCKIVSSIAKSTLASEPSRKLPPLVSKSFICFKCHTSFSKKDYLRKHIIREACKMKCNTCGRKIRRAFWAKHVIRCKQNQSKKENHSNHKSHQDVEEKSEPCNIPGSNVKSTMANGSLRAFRIIKKPQLHQMPRNV